MIKRGIAWHSWKHCLSRYWNSGLSLSEYCRRRNLNLKTEAFVINDIRKLIDIGLSKIPLNSRIARSVKLASELYDRKTES